MHRFPIYFIRQILPWFALALFGLDFLFLATQLIRIAPIFAGSEAPLKEIGKALWLSLVPISGWAATPAFSLAVFATAGKMRGDGELLAFDSSGLRRVYLWAGPLLVAFVLFVAIGLTWLVWAPACQGAVRSIAVEMAGRALLGKIEPGRFETPVSKVTFYADAKVNKGWFRGVLIEDARNERSTARLTAENALISVNSNRQSMSAVLKNGTGFITFSNQSTSPFAVTFETMKIEIPIGEEITKTLDFMPLSIATSTKELLKPPLDANPERWRFALFARIAAVLSFLCMAILSIALALRLWIQKMGQAVAVSAAIYLVYHLLVRFFESLLDSGVLSAPAAALIPVGLIATAAAAAMIPKGIGN